MAGFVSAGKPRYRGPDFFKRGPSNVEPSPYLTHPAGVPVRVKNYLSSSSGLNCLLMNFGRLWSPVFVTGILISSRKLSRQRLHALKLMPRMTQDRAKHSKTAKAFSGQTYRVRITPRWLVAYGEHHCSVCPTDSATRRNAA